MPRGTGTGLVVPGGDAPLGVATTSRSWAQYVDMFDLDDDPPGDGPVLICPAGAGAVGDGTGLAVGVDPVYAMGRSRALADAEEFERWLRGRDGDEVSERDLAFRAGRAVGLAEFAVSSAPLVAAALPDLPFADGSFAVALCSHLLFCYPQLGRGFHQAALEELTRVAREVRVFPLLPGARGGGQEATPGWFREVLDGAGRHRVGTTRYRYWDHQREYLVLGVGA